MAQTKDWREVWREGVAPSLPTKGLEALARALADDDPNLLQGATTVPPPLMSVQDWPVEAACLIGYAHWKGSGLATVAEVEEAFATTCFECDQAIGEPAACRWLLNAYDDMPRDEMRRLLAGEVSRTLAEREAQTA